MLKAPQPYTIPSVHGAPIHTDLRCFSKSQALKIFYFYFSFLKHVPLFRLSTVRTAALNNEQGFICVFVLFRISIMYLKKNKKTIFPPLGLDFLMYISCGVSCLLLSLSSFMYQHGIAVSNGLICCCTPFYMCFNMICLLQ